MWKLKIPAFAAILVAGLALCIINTIYSVQDIQRSSYLERAKSVNLVMSKIGDHLNIAFESRWNKSRFLSKRVERIHADSIDDLISVLNDIHVETGEDFKVVDNEGIAYYNDGVQEYWKDHRAVPPKTETFILSPLQFGITNENYMKYIVPLKVPLVIGDTEIVYTVLTEPLSDLRKEFNTGNYGEGCLSFIIAKDGTFIYENGADDPMADSYNFLAYVEKAAKFKYDESFEKFESNIQNGINNTALVEYNGKNYYLSHFDLDMENWASIMLVPEENTQVGYKSFTQKLLVNLASVFSTSFILFVIFFLYMWKNTVTKQRLAVEAERRSNEAKTNFLSSMSHDMRTPMNAIIGLTEIALRSKEGISGPVREILNKIHLSSTHLLMLINDILDISKIESGKMSLNIAEFSIVEAVNTLTNLIRPLAKEKNIDLRIHTYNFCHEHVIGDELRISQVCINLATNAIKYTPSGGSVVIDFMQEVDDDAPSKVQIICIVRDNGIGMSEEYKKVMYENFSRATDSRVNRVAGSGLGLPICKRILEMMEGTLECDSSLGKGTTFTASVMLEKGRADIVYEMPNTCILVVDRDSVSTDALKRIFDRLSIKSVIINDSAMLTTVIKQEPAYQAAFVELGVFENKGLDTVRELRKYFGKNFPIVLTDIADMVEYAEQIAEAGVEYTMNKPYFYRTVYEILQKALENKGTEADTEIKTEEQFSSRMNLLVAEDNDMNWMIISTLLEMNGISVERAENGSICMDMLNSARRGQYAAVLMDVRMPVMNGIETTQMIRKSKIDWLRAMPVIAMTADAFAEDIQACMEAGMDEHLTKPINLERLLSILSGLNGGVKPNLGINA